MSNFLQEKIEQFKQYQQEMKHRKFTRKDAAIGVSATLAVTAMACISNFNPGVINYPQASNKEQKVSIAELTKLAGPQQTIDMEEQNPLKRRVQKQTETTPKAVTSTPLPSFSGLSGFTPSSSTGKGSGIASPNLEKSKETYARHTELTDKMKALLNSSFTLKNMSKTPVGMEDRFTSSFEFANAEGTVVERFELMSIVRTSRLESIKTAQDVLDSLVEESQAIHIIESKDDYLIYDFAGDGGYQVGKIAVDDKGIYIFGYVNLTTSDMPEVLKTEWINHYRNDL